MPTLTYFKTPCHLTSPKDVNDFIRSELLFKLERKRQQEEENQTPEVVRGSGDEGGKSTIITRIGGGDDQVLVPRKIELDTPKERDDDTDGDCTVSKEDGRNLDLTQEEEGGEERNRNSRSRTTANRGRTKPSPDPERKSTRLRNATASASSSPTQSPPDELSNVTNLMVKINLWKRSPTMITISGKKQSPCASPLMIDDGNDSGMHVIQSVLLETGVGRGLDKERDEIWHYRLAELKAYREKFGHCNVPYVDTSNAALRAWIEKQRDVYRILREFEWRHRSKTGPKANKRIRELEELGLEFHAKPIEWYDHFEELRRFTQKHGHCNPHQDRAVGQLARWVTSQRQKYRIMIERGTGSMTTKRAGLLTSIGMSWNKTSDNWDSRFQSLKQFKEKYGHMNVSRRAPQHKALGFWVYGQRRKYKFSKETGTKPMKEHERKALESIGFEWEETVSPDTGKRIKKNRARKSRR